MGGGRGGAAAPKGAARRREQLRNWGPLLQLLPPHPPPKSFPRYPHLLPGASPTRAVPNNPGLPRPLLPLDLLLLDRVSSCCSPKLASRCASSSARCWSSVSPNSDLPSWVGRMSADELRVLIQQDLQLAIGQHLEAVVIDVGEFVGRALYGILPIGHGVDMCLPHIPWSEPRTWSFCQKIFSLGSVVVSCGL